MQQRTIIVSLLAAALVFGFGTASAKGTAAAGKTKAAACEACHGADGNGIAPNYPALAGQYQDYIAQVLHEYKDGQRNNPIMKGMVATLSDQDIEDVATYFSSLPSKLDTLKGHISGDK